MNHRITRRGFLHGTSALSLSLMLGEHESLNAGEPLRRLVAGAGEAVARLERAALVLEALLLDRVDLVAAFGGDKE